MIQCWEPGPIANSRFTEAEMAKIENPTKKKVATDDDGWITLFDGKSLKGWKASENPDSWTVVDGAFRGNGKRSHLFYMGNQAPFTNFEFKVDIKTLPGANSGVYFHTKYQEKGWPGAGVECQVNSTYPKDPKRSASLYNLKNITEVLTEDNKWWTLQIKVTGGKNVEVRIDGKIVNTYTEPEGQKSGMGKMGSGTFAFQEHDPSGTVFIKNVKVKKLD